jgi:hypothetical protein
MNLKKKKKSAHTRLRENHSQQKEKERKNEDKSEKKEEKRIEGIQVSVVQDTSTQAAACPTLSSRVPIAAGRSVAPLSSARSRVEPS